MNTFDKIAGKYKEKAIIQQTAASKLISLMEIQRSDDIIDIACGPGHITYSLSKMTEGKVLGIDISEAMIQQAKKLYPCIDFRQIAAEDIDFNDKFDIAFCNSSLIWFVNPQKAIKGIFNALKIGGRLFLACPATADWSPWFTRIISKVTTPQRIRRIFSHWRNPWFFLPAIDDYRRFFENQGFNTEFIEINHEKTRYSVEEAFNIYLSGAGNGFTGKRYYDIDIDDAYIHDFNGQVMIEIQKESTNGTLDVDFNRLYYIGKKT